MCLTWEQKKGLFQVFVDGFEECSGTTHPGYIIQPMGQFLLGREQLCHSENCSSKNLENFKGNISHLSMWSYVLHTADIAFLSKERSYRTGNVLGWSDFKNSAKGELLRVNISAQLKEGKHPSNLNPSNLNPL